MSLLPASKNRLLVCEFLILLAIGLIIGVLFGSFEKQISSESAITFLTLVADISTTILSIFFAAALLLVGRSKDAIHRVMSKKDFVAGSFLFTLTIFYSLINILTMETNTTMDLRSFDSFMLVGFPLTLMVFSIVVVSFFLWKLALDQHKTN